MRVNGDKTAMVNLSGAQSYDARAFIRTAEGGEVRSERSMKVLGFHFGQTPTVHEHVAVLCKRVRRKFWVLYHLRRAGFSDDELAKVYRICIRPVLDYCQVVYHPLLTDEQDQAVEGLQASALRCIYGHHTSYARMRELAGVELLRDRSCLLYTSPSPRDS